MVDKVIDEVYWKPAPSDYWVGEILAQDILVHTETKCIEGVVGRIEGSAPIYRAMVRTRAIGDYLDISSAKKAVEECW